MNRRSMLLVGCLLLLALGLNSACALPAADFVPAPSPTPLAPLDALTDAIATAEATNNQPWQAAAYYERGNLKFDQGTYAAAIADYDQALAIDPGHARAYHNRGLAYASLGDVDKALADYTRAIESDPGYVRAYQNRVSLLAQQGDLRGLAADYGRLAELDPERRATYAYGQGQALFRLRELAAARQALDATLAADPDHVDARYTRALIHAAEGRSTEAIADLDRALSLSPRAANAYYARALAHAARGDQTSALADFTKTLELEPDNQAARIGRATMLLATGDHDAARADLDRLQVEQLDPALQQAVATVRMQLAAAP